MAPAWQHAAAEASQPDQHFAGCQEMAFASVHLSQDHLPELHSTSNFRTQDWAGMNNWLTPSVVYSFLFHLTDAG